MKSFMASKIISFFLSGLVMGITIVMLPEIGNATTFHVAKTGKDSNAGTARSPFQTIKKGIGHLSAGDTLYVHSGTYSESIRSWETPIPNGTSWNQPITIAAFPGDTVQITPGSGKAFFWIQDGQDKYLIINGFNIDGRLRAYHGFIFNNYSRHIRVQNCEIKNTYNSGIHVGICAGCADPANYPNDTYHEFLNLNVHHNGKAPDYPKNAHGFYIETSYNLVANGTFHHNAGNGGKFFHGNLPKLANHNIARNNRFFENSQSGKWSCGLLLSSGDGNMAHMNIAYKNFAGFCIQTRVTNARLFNNLSYENDVYGIYVGRTTTSRSKVENNTVYKNGTYGIFVGDGAKDSTVTNNISYLNANNSMVRNIGLHNQTRTKVAFNLTTNPMFENAQTKDFRLRVGSPAIDKGDSIQISDDLAGTSRPQGSSHDIGAYERIFEIDEKPPASPSDVSVR